MELGHGGGARRRTEGPRIKMCQKLESMEVRRDEGDNLVSHWSWLLLAPRWDPWPDHPGSLRDHDPASQHIELYLVNG